MQRQHEKYRSFCEEDDEETVHDQTVLNTDHIGTNIVQLKPGDHIAWERLYLIWHHAIVENINNNVLEVIHFSGNVYRAEIKNTEWENSRLFRINYPKRVIDANPPYVVLGRANKMIKQNESYNLISNNCEHLATYCKTGKRTSYQVKWVKKKALEVACESAIPASKTLAEQMLRPKTIFKAAKLNPRKATQLAATQRVGNQLAKTSPAGQLAGNTQAAREASKFAKASKLVNRIGTAVAIVAEVWVTGQDIYKFAQQKDSGQISASHANQLITERISESVIGGVASHYGGILGAKTGALLGVQIGSLAGPVGTAVGAVAGAVAGGFVGSFASTSVGKCIGTVVGRCLGRWCWW